MTTTRKTSCTILWASAIAVAAAAAPSARATVDIVRQDIVVDDARVDGDIAITIDAELVQLDGDPSLVYFDPLADLQAISVDGRPLSPHAYPGFSGVVSLVDDLGIALGEHAVLHMELQGALRCSDCVRSADELVLLPSGPGSAWSLLNLLATDAFVGTIEVRERAGLDVVAGEGTPTEIVDDGDTVTWRYRFEAPTELLFVFARDGAQARHGGAVTYFSGADGHAAAAARLAEVADVARTTYDGLFGALPVDEVHVVLSSSTGFPFGAMGMLGNVLSADFLVDDRFGYLVEQGAAHELGHSWWGGVTSASDPIEGGVLQEGLAEYSAWRAVAALHDDDDDARLSGVRMNAVWYMLGRGSVGDDDIAPLDPGIRDSPAAIFAMYHKGSCFYRTLEEKVGIEAFTDALAALVARGPGGLTVAHLVEDVQAASGIDVQADVDQWLGAEGFPALTFGVDAADADGARATLHVDGDFAIDVPVVATGWRADGAPLEVRSVVHAQPGDNEVELAVGGLVRVDVDPRWSLVRTVAPRLHGDVSLDGRVDALDLALTALHTGSYLPTVRREDGGYDPLYDVDGDGAVAAADLDDIAAHVDGDAP